MKKYQHIILGIALLSCVCGGSVYADEVPSLAEIRNTLEEATNGTTNTSTTETPVNFTRDGIYGCGGIKSPVGLQHAQGTFVPVSEEAVALNTYILVNKFCVLDALNNRQREAVVSELLRAATTGINMGPDGRPQYSQNVPAEQLEIADQVAQKFIDDSSLNNICAPYRDSVKQAVLKNYQGKTRKQAETYACKFPGSADQMQKLLQGNLDEGGGFQALLSLIQSGNDPLSAYTYANETLYRNIQSSQEDELRQLEWGNGFRSQKECSQIPIGNGKFEEQCNIVTPGKIVGDMASYISQTGFRQTENADSIDELLGGFITNFQNQVLSSFTGFKGTTESRNGQPSYLDRTAQDSTWNARIETTNVGINALNVALAAERQYLSVRTATKTILEGFMTRLRQLEDNCYNAMIARAKSDTKQKLEDRVCVGGGVGGVNFGTCGATVNDTVTDAPGNSDANEKKYHTIIAQSGNETETVKLLITRDKSNAIINTDAKQLLIDVVNSIKKSQDTLAILEKLDSMMNNTAESQTLTRLALSTLDQLASKRALHTVTDVAAAQNQKTQINDALNLLYDRTKNDWENTWCKDDKWVDYKVN